MIWKSGSQLGRVTVVIDVLEMLLACCNIASFGYVVLKPCWEIKRKTWIKTPI